MKKSIAVFTVLLASLTACGSDDSSSPTTLTLQNDSFTSGTPSFQAGFVANEGAAVVLGPQARPYTVEKVLFLFGGATTGQTVTLSISVDDGTGTPGTGLFANDYAITPSNTAFQEIDLSSESVAVSAGQRVWISMMVFHDGLPGFAVDADGLTAGRNFVFTDQWYSGATVGLTGDWVIRAEIRTN